VERQDFRKGYPPPPHPGSPVGLAGVCLGGVSGWGVGKNALHGGGGYALPLPCRKEGTGSGKGTGDLAGGRAGRDHTNQPTS
jgi:hypothetical protein